MAETFLRRNDQKAAFKYWNDDGIVYALPGRTPEGLYWPRHSFLIEILVAKILRLQIQNFQRNEKRRLITSAAPKPTRLVSSMNSVPDLHPLVGEDRLDRANIDMETDVIGSVGYPAIATLEKQEAEQIKASAVPPTSSQPSVQIFATDQDLIDTLRAWRKSHDNKAPPGTNKFRAHDLHDKPTKQVKVSNGLAEVGRLQVDAEYMCWVLKQADDTSILVTTWSGGRAGTVRYRGWLGGDWGFTNHHIATTCTPPTPSKSVRKRLSVAESSSDESSEHDEPVHSFDSSSERVDLPVATRQSSRQTGESRSYSLMRASGRSRASLDHASVDSSTLPKSSVPTGQVERDVSRRQTLPPKVGAQKAKTTNFVDEVLEDWEAAGNTSLSPSVTRKLPSEAASSINTKKRGRPASAQLAPPPAKQAVTKGSKVHFHFFLSDPSHGAVIKSSSLFPSAQAFCDAALAVWALLDSKTRRQDIAAIKVSWNGCKQPVVVPWGDVEAYENMMTNVVKGEENSDGVIEAEVRCLAIKH